MHTLTYISSATTLMAVPDLVDLLEQIRPKNHALGLTGMLVYSGGGIIQALEGPRRAVDEVFEAIEVDPRHRDVTVLERRPVEGRVFSDWSMGFRNLDRRELHDATTFQAFLRGPAGSGLGDDAVPTYDLVSLFRTHHAA
ncbi:BLUF domain-containing protein [Nocardioides currus]|uniref:BLUF domain-containing protein n=1 Tax=Nocardioides currus TaxID=2133958 RepID=A0A2R7YZA9_9ACTN|nr:BLUF domain-containing protein [Nocardioides currus]PUA81229.1 hypothetical protein C7S10_09335 [Nocardioides currus]